MVNNILKAFLSEPFQTPAMPGGIFAVNAHWFAEIGSFDQKMEIWGGENIDLSLRSWLCGGSMYIIPCSHVGHVFRAGFHGSSSLKYQIVSLKTPWNPDKDIIPHISSI